MTLITEGMEETNLMEGLEIDEDFSEETLDKLKSSIIPLKVKEDNQLGTFIINYYREILGSNEIFPAFITCESLNGEKMAQLFFLNPEDFDKKSGIIAREAKMAYEDENLALFLSKKGAYLAITGEVFLPFET
ncbi:MAG: hypothetical protein PHP08_03185 [Candidatus Dojkabacteria bacterium]|nr:hypothetical protein [Candidatus Dojkabacteria bacterium]